MTKITFPQKETYAASQFCLSEIPSALRYLSFDQFSHQECAYAAPKGRSLGLRPDPMCQPRRVAERASLPDRNFACQLCVWCLRKELVSYRFHLKSQIGLCIIDGVWFSQLRWNQLFNGWRHSWSSAACLGQRFILSDHFLIHTHLAVNLELELWFIILFYFATANLTHYHN